MKKVLLLALVITLLTFASVSYAGGNPQYNYPFKATYSWAPCDSAIPQHYQIQTTYTGTATSCYTVTWLTGPAGTPGPAVATDCGTYTAATIPLIYNATINLSQSCTTNQSCPVYVKAGPVSINPLFEGYWQEPCNATFGVSTSGLLVGKNNSKNTPVIGFTAVGASVGPSSCLSQ